MDVRICDALIMANVKYYTYNNLYLNIVIKYINKNWEMIISAGCWTDPVVTLILSLQNLGTDSDREAHHCRLPSARFDSGSDVG